MRKLAVALILASVVTFLIAAILVIFRRDSILSINTGPEGFSRASSNLALIAIALGVWFRADRGGPDDDALDGDD